MPSQSHGKRQLATKEVPVKRFRVSRACDQCRTAREKCDGNEPICLPCVDLKRACTYTSNPRKRGLQPGYIRSLELTLAFVFQQNVEIEALVNKELAQERTVLLARGSRESNRLHKSWRKSRFCRDVTKALAGEPIDYEGDRLPSSEDESEVDAEDANLLHSMTNTRPLEHMSWTHDADAISRRLEAPALSDRPSTSNQQDTLPLALTPLPVDCWKLLETYSTYTQCWLPMCEKLDVLKLSYAYPTHGLPLSHEMPDSGSHAEMWSVFAVGCMQISSYTTENREHRCELTPNQLYNTAKSLIPDELGRFDMNHVKAVLNMAVFNISRSLLNAAWLLVGTASRMFSTLNDLPETASPRRNKVLACCFLLDNFLALHLNRRPYLDKSDLAWAGKIEEDGMEEWQPWSGDLLLGTTNQSRLPTLALSTFNNLLEVLDILVNTARQPTARNFLHEMTGRLEIWKSSLPAKLDYIQADSASIPLTPPAGLLQLTYFTSAFALVPSQAWLQRVLDLLELLRAQLGLARMPSIIVCLFQSIQRSSTGLNLDHNTRDRMRRFFADFDQASCMTSSDAILEPYRTQSAHVDTPSTLNQMCSPDLARTTPHLYSSQDVSSIPEHYQPLAGSSSLFEDLLPDMNPNQQDHTLQSLNARSFAIPITNTRFEPEVFGSPDPYETFVPGDLESFFDELSSLHGAKKLQNQSQFMQNLGFSSEVSMADLLEADPGRFMPLPYSDFGPSNSKELSNLPLNPFYDAG